MRNRLGRLQIRLPWGIDWSLYAVPIILAFVGIIIIFSVSYATKPTLMITQIVSTAIGLGLAIAITFIDYRNFKGLSLILYLIVIVLLVLVLFVGGKSFGATRWINLGFYQLQPSEIGKLFIALFLARIFAETEEFNWKRVLLAFFIIIVPIALIMRQPDLGTALVIFVSLIALLFFSPIKKRLLAGIIAVMILAAPVGWHFLKPYQKERIYTFINPSSDPYESGYNVTQARITVGSGGLLGQGIGRGTQIQLNFLPVAHADFIFASTAEAVGFVGSILLIGLLIFMVVRVINVSRVAKDSFGFYFAICWAFVLLFQILVNIGMNIGIMPVTGIPLPFVSYGGSSMLTNMLAVGILQSIYLRHRKISF